MGTHYHVVVSRTRAIDRARQCQGKVRHLDRGCAIQEARRIQRCSGGPTEVYHCAWCGCFHVGHARGGQ